MQQLKLRYARPDESGTILDWLKANETVNHFNPDLLSDATLRVLCSYDKDGPVLFHPVVRTLVLESAAPRPGVSPLVAAQAFRDTTKGALLLASAEQISAVHALDCGGGLQRMATSNHYELLGTKNPDSGEFEAFRVYRIAAK